LGESSNKNKKSIAWIKDFENYRDLVLFNKNIADMDDFYLASF
jgi:hypothetical protein